MSLIDKVRANARTGHIAKKLKSLVFALRLATTALTLYRHFFTLQLIGRSDCIINHGFQYTKDHVESTHDNEGTSSRQIGAPPANTT
jgi:hypothetical protein